MPTALERTGDFSLTLSQPFPGNIIPANRIGPSGEGILALFQFPNIAPFVQDDGKVTPKLNLNMGIRYEFLPPLRLRATGSTRRP